MKTYQLPIEKTKQATETCHIAEIVLRLKSIKIKCDIVISKDLKIY